MKYDDASWHSGNDFPDESPQEYSGTHIALFMKWCFVREMAGEIHLVEEPEATSDVILGNLSATEFFFKYCDGKLTDEDFNNAGNEFASRYYGDDGLYLSDYTDCFEELMFEAPESKHDFDVLAQVIEKRFISGVATESELQKFNEKNSKKPWWKLW